MKQYFFSSFAIVHSAFWELVQQNCRRHKRISIKHVDVQPVWYDGKQKVYCTKQYDLKKAAFWLQAVALVSAE